MGKLTDTSKKAGILAKLTKPSSLSILVQSTILLLLMTIISFTTSNGSHDKQTQELFAEVNSMESAVSGNFDLYVVLNHDDLADVTLIANEGNENNNFVVEMLGTISGTVLEVTDNNDIGDAAIADVTITLTNVDTGTTVTTTTDENGYYEFTDLGTGNYTVAKQVEAEIDEDYVDVVDGDDCGDSDVTNSIMNSSGSTSDLFSVGNGGTITSKNMGLNSIYSIGNRVWLDTDYNGVINTGEIGLSDIFIELYIIDSVNMNTLIDTTSTDNDGYYLFDSLGSAEYFVVIPATEIGLGGTLYDYHSTTGSFNSGGIFEDASNPIDADNDINLDDNGVLDGNTSFPGAVLSDTVTLGESMEPFLEGDHILETDNDDSGAEDINSNLTIDFGFVSKVYDIALTKTTDSFNNNEVGDTIKFMFTVSNEGNTPMTNIIISDINPTGFIALDALNMPLGWTSIGQEYIDTIMSVLEPGSDITIDFFVELNSGSTREEFTNVAEIVSYENLQGISSDILKDIDSAPANNNDQEDDQDFAEAFPCGEDCYLTCKGQMNISVDPLTCKALVKPSAISENIDESCDFYYIITLFDQYGVQLPTDSVDASYIGQLLTYELSEPGCDINANKCWGTVLIEDKIAPSLTAQDFTVSCADLNEDGTVEMLLPIVGDDCQNTLLPVLVKQEEIDVDCDDPNSDRIISTIIRKYLVQDSGGNISDTAVQTITLERVMIGNINAPSHIVFPFDILSCSSGFDEDDFGHPVPSETGVPTTDGGTDLYPFPEDVFCNGFSEYYDVVLLEDSCVTKILRTFTIGEWRCNDTEDRPVTQFIDIVDVEGPLMTQLPDITETTAPFSCAANVLLSAVTATDICNTEDIVIDIEFIIENGIEPRRENVNGAQLVTMPTGIHTVTYIATDRCGNETRMSITVNVQDKSNPQAICDADILYVSDGPSFFSAVALDNGSFDDCGAVNLLIARSDDPLYPTLTAFSDKLEFDCDDIGNTYEVVLLVTDIGGNTSICTNDLIIEDKIPGMFLSSSIPSDVTLDCTMSLDDYYADPNNLPTVVDNCTSTTFTTSIEVIEEINNCGTGEVRRIFTVDDLNGASVSNVITIINLNGELMANEIVWPNDFDDTDVNIDATPGGLANIDPIYGFPMVTNLSSCIKVGENYQDDTTVIEEGVSLSIKRTWKIIDWCAQNSDGTFPTFVDTQYIDLGTPTGTLMANISGMIYTEDTEEIESVHVSLMADDAVFDMTEETGEYAFPDMSVGGDYMILPYKNDDHENGVSTLDLVLIQRHILGISQLDSPYKMIAADINHTQSISASDIVILRKLILGVYDEFPSNNSWRFIDVDYEFPDVTDPWLESLPEDYEINILESHMNVDFIGVKTGDVNGSVTANAQSITTETRTDDTWSLNIDDKKVEPGDLIMLEVKSTDDTKVFGWQYTFETDGLELKDVIPSKANVTVHNIYNDKGTMHVSFSDANGIDISSDEVLYTFVLQAKKRGQLSNLMSLSDRGLKAESYHREMDIRNVGISWNEFSDDPTTLAYEFSVEQNEPNPWYDRTTVGYYIPEAGDVRFVVKDVAGRTLFSTSAYREKGKHTEAIEARFLESNGVLLYELRYDDQVISNRMIHIK